MLPSAEPDEVKLLQLVTDDSQAAAHEVLVYDTETGAAHVRPKTRSAIPKSWGGVYSTPSAALVAARAAGYEPTALYYSHPEEEPPRGLGTPRERD